MFRGCELEKICYNSDVDNQNIKEDFIVKQGFTLAEVLVTLGIIGVVSAMTVPTLMQNYQRKSYVTQLHKVYNELSQAVVMYQTDRNAVNLTEAGLNSLDAISNFFKNYFKVVQDCGNDSTPCFADSYKKISGVDSQFYCNNNCIVLASGASIGTNNELRDGQTIIAQIVVDVNGQKGPNVFGRDAFSLFLYKNGVIDDLIGADVSDDENYDWGIATAPLSKEQREENFNYGCISSNGGHYHGCFGKILNDNWEMTY